MDDFEKIFSSQIGMELRYMEVTKLMIEADAINVEVEAMKVANRANRATFCQSDFQNKAIRLLEIANSIWSMEKD